MNIKDQLQKAPAKKYPNNPSVKDEPGDSDSEYPAPEEDRSIYRDKSARDMGSDTKKNDVPANDAGIYSEEDMEEEEGETDDLPDDVPNQQEGDAQLYKEAKKEPGYDPEY